MTILRFEGLWPWWLILIVGVVGSWLIARWYWQESKHLASPSRWILPLCRGSAFFLIVFMLAGPTLYHQRIQGELSRIRVLLDNSRSMSTPDVSPVGMTRLQRVVGWLFGNQEQGETQGWLHELRRHHRVDLMCSNQESKGGPIWDSLSNAAMPDADRIETVGANTALGEFLLEGVPSGDRNSPKSKSDFAAIVMISDGQSNAGVNILDAAQRCVEEKIPVYMVGVGGQSEPSDLGIIQVEHSQQVYRPDRLRGTILLKDRMKAGTPCQIEIQHLGQTVFSKRIESTDQGLRRIEFDIPAENLLDRAKANLPKSATYTALPIDLKFIVESKVDEVSLENNSYFSSLWGVERKNRILLLDRRGGWEMRYIKNAFERDTTWEPTIAIGRSAFDDEVFPNSRAALFEFDLIVSSLETIRILSDEQLKWTADFVSHSGGGIILIDSPRERTSKVFDSAVSALLPVRFLETQANNHAKTVRVNPSAKAQSALQLGSSQLPNAAVWSALPPPKSFCHIALVPGAESMVDLMAEEVDKPLQPLVATKLFGQGRVLYVAADETWRWRYDVADRYHQRFWSQIATWAMRTPFAVTDSFVALDAGSRVYAPNDSIPIRARLKRDDLRPMLDASARAILEKDGGYELSLPLDQDSDARGFYRATAGPLAPGRYLVRLQVDGVPEEAFQVQTQFDVLPSIDVEMQTLACNSSLLRQTAAVTGGEMVMMDDVATISEKLSRYRTGSIVESQTLLWQSYPWFAAIVGLLTVEWLVRKRKGLI